MAEGKRGFFATWAMVMFRPSALFAEPKRQRSGWGPLRFAMLSALLGTPIGATLEHALLGGPSQETFSVLVAWLVLAPLGALASVLFTAALVHFWLYVVRAKHAAFGETLACAGYCSGASLLGLVPFVGAPIAQVWQLVILVLGVMRVRSTTAPRAAFAVLASPASLVVVALLLRAGVIEAFKIPSGGMRPSLEVNDHLFVSKLAYGPSFPFSKQRLYARPPSRGDLIVFELPDPDGSRPRQDFVKRVIAVEGDTLEVDDGHPVINGWRVPTCYAGRHEYADPNGTRAPGEIHVEFLGAAAYLTFYEDERFDGKQGPYRVAAGETWVLGDNRNNSADSRSWLEGRGAGVPFANVKGRASWVWMAFDQEGLVAWDRVGLDTSARPVAPPGAKSELVAGIAACLASRPSRTAPGL